jgi:hypothetical protein
MGSPELIEEIPDRRLVTHRRPEASRRIGEARRKSMAFTLAVGQPGTAHIVEIARFRAPRSRLTAIRQTDQTVFDADGENAVTRFESSSRPIASAGDDFVPTDRLFGDAALDSDRNEHQLRSVLGEGSKSAFHGGELGWILRTNPNRLPGERARQRRRRSKRFFVHQGEAAS